jgi:hypothetical protein
VQSEVERLEGIAAQADAIIAAQSGEPPPAKATGGKTSRPRGSSRRGPSSAEVAAYALEHLLCTTLRRSTTYALHGRCGGPPRA